MGDDTQEGRIAEESDDENGYNATAAAAAVAEDHGASDDDKDNSRGAQQEPDFDDTIVVDFQFPKVEIFHPDIDEEQAAVVNPGMGGFAVEEEASKELVTEEQAMEAPDVPSSPRHSNETPGVDRAFVATAAPTLSNAGSGEGGIGNANTDPLPEEFRQRLVAMADENRLLRQQAEETETRNRLLRQHAEAATNQNQLTANDNQLLRQQAVQTTNENQLLRQQVEDTKGPSLKAQVIIAIVSALFGWNAPIIFDVDKIIDGNYGPAFGIQKVTLSSCPRILFYALISIVDFSDAVLDIVVSVRGLLQGDDDVLDEDSKTLRRWALTLFFMTIAARLLAGVFGVVYYRIDKSDRLVSYFLVEMTIFVMEDLAAATYLLVKHFSTIRKADRETGNSEVEMDPFDEANAILTLICGFVFVIPSLCRYKSMTKRLPCSASCFLMLWCLSVGIASPSMVIWGNVSDSGFRWVFHNFEQWMRVCYPIIVVVQLYILYHWSQYLYRKNPPQSRDLEAREELSS